jgi:molybdenum cofactor synthesis domain-containing protein
MDFTAVCTIENVTNVRNEERAASEEGEKSARKRVPLTAVVMTVSDSCAAGRREDSSGPAVERELETRGFEIVRRVTVADDQRLIEDALRRAAGEARLVVTTGGTGIGPRDVTPEATRLAALSRGVCGTRDTALILNVPGSPAGAVSSLRAALPVLPHALELLAGATEHGSGKVERS